MKYAVGEMSGLWLGQGSGSGLWVDASGCVLCCLFIACFQLKVGRKLVLWVSRQREFHVWMEH